MISYLLFWCTQLVITSTVVTFVQSEPYPASDATGDIFIEIIPLAEASSISYVPDLGRYFLPLLHAEFVDVCMVNIGFNMRRCPRD